MTPPRRPLRAVGALVAAVVTILGVAAPASAHDELERTQPADGATVTTLPGRLLMTFDEAVDADAVVVKHGSSRLAVSSVPGKPATVAVDLGDVEDAKDVTLAWTAVAEDGHQSSGSIELHVRRSQAEAAGTSGLDAGPPPGPAHADLIRPAEITARVAGYLGMAVLVGGLIVVSALWPAGARDRRTRVVLLASVVAGVGSACAAIGITIWRTDGAVDLTTVLTESFGRAEAGLVLVWLLAAVVVADLLQRGESAARNPAWRAGALLVGLALILLTSMNAHASQIPGSSLGRVADVLHLVGMSAWVGGLTVLTVGLLPRRRLDELQDVVPRFSKIAVTAVLLVVASGLVLVWELLWPLQDTWTTHYARVLLVKLAIVGMVLVAALGSKRWVGRVVSGASDGRRAPSVRAITASVVAETVLLTAVLGAASVLATSSPGT